MWYERHLEIWKQLSPQKLTPIDIHEICWYLKVWKWVTICPSIPHISKQQIVSLSIINRYRQCYFESRIYLKFDNQSVGFRKYVRNMHICIYQPSLFLDWRRDRYWHGYV